MIRLQYPILDCWKLRYACFRFHAIVTRLGWNGVRKQIERRLKTFQSAQEKSPDEGGRDFDALGTYFDGVFANAALFHVPSQELPRVLLELHASLKPGGVLFSSNPHGHNEEGWNGGRYAVYYDLMLGAATYRLQGSLSFPTITGLPACRGKGSLG